MSRVQARGRPPHSDLLTPAEWRVAEGVRHGLTNRAIAERLEVSADAVKYHVANILGKQGFSRRSELRVWPGVRNDSNLSQMPANSAAALQLGTIGQVARTVSDIERSRRWFEDILQLEFLYAFEKIAFFNCDGTRLFLCEGETLHASILYFSVPDIRLAHTSLVERGVVFISAPHMIHRHGDGSEEWMAFFNDNEDRPLAIMSKIPPQAADRPQQEFDNAD